MMKNSARVAALMVVLALGYILGSQRSSSQGGAATAGPVWDAAAKGWVHADGTSLTIWGWEGGQVTGARTYHLSSTSTKPDEKGLSQQNRFVTYEIWSGPARVTK